jgi:hypothetical protein
LRQGAAAVALLRLESVLAIDGEPVGRDLALRADLTRTRGSILRVGHRLEAVVEAAEEAVEQVALCGGVSIAGHAAPVVVGSGTG